jgi:hypothetical protein
MQKRLVIGVVGFCLVYLLAACADQSTVTSSQAATFTESTLPVGSYQATLVMAPASKVLLSNNFDSEIWTLELVGSGRYTLKYFETPWFEGNYSANNNEVIFSSGQELQSCGSSDEPLQEGVYNWIYDGQVLILNEIEDSCNLRKQVLTSQPLLAQQ